jgi:hypothetical protein
MTDDDLTPWEENERLEKIEEVLWARGLPSPSDAAGGKSQIVNPASTTYPPPYDAGKSVEPDKGGDD